MSHSHLFLFSVCAAFFQLSDALTNVTKKSQASELAKFLCLSAIINFFENEPKTYQNIINSHSSTEQREKLLIMLTTDLVSAIQALELINTLDIGYAKAGLLGDALMLSGRDYKKRELHDLMSAGLSLSAASSYLARKNGIKKSVIYNLN